MSLTTFQTALAAAHAGTGQARILFVGDSLVEGEGASTRANRWIDKLVGKLRTDQSIGGSGVGLTPPRYAVGSNGGNSEGWGVYHDQAVSTGTVWWEGPDGDNSIDFTQGLKGMCLNPSASLTFTVTGDSADVVVGFANDTFAEYDQVTSPALISVDGTLVATVPVGTGQRPGVIQHISLGSAGTHTIKVAANSTGLVHVDGVVVYNGDYTAGITYWDDSHSGLESADLTGNPNVAGWSNFLPHLVIDELIGVNDLTQGGQTPTQCAANFQTRINAYKALSSNPSIVLAIPLKGGGLSSYTNGGKTFDDYAAACISVANSNGVTVYDSRTAYPSPASTYFQSDNVHPNDSGQLLFANALAAAIEPAAGSTYAVTSSRAATTSSIGAVAKIAAVTGSGAATTGRAAAAQLLASVAGSAAATTTSAGAVTVTAGAQTYPVTGGAATTGSSTGAAVLLAAIAGQAAAATASAAAATLTAQATGTAAATTSASGSVSVIPAASDAVAGDTHATTSSAGSVTLTGAAVGHAQALTDASAYVAAILAVTGAAQALTGSHAVVQSSGDRLRDVTVLASLQPRRFAGALIERTMEGSLE